MAQPFSFRWTSMLDDPMANITFKYADWDALLDIVKDLAGDPTCAYQGRFHAGGRNIVRRIELPEKGEVWIVRVPQLYCRPGEASTGNWWTAWRRFTLDSEIATMIHITQNSDIPVPKVFGYNTSIEGNPAKVPYMLMECIEGNMMYDLGGEKIFTDEHKAKIRRSLASIQCKLAAIPLPKLGSLVLKPDGGVDMGPLRREYGCEGPFSSVADLVRAWLRRNYAFSHNAEAGSLCFEHAKLFPKRLEAAVEDQSLLPPGYSTTYPILHTDFGMHNILLNDDYDIVGIIDWEDAHTVPLEVFAILSNEYTEFCFDKGTLDLDSQGKLYWADVAAEEKDNDDSSPKLSEAVLTPLAHIGFCMSLYQRGKRFEFCNVLDRLDKLDKRAD